MLSWYNFRIMRYMRKGQKPYSFSLFLRSMRMIWSRTLYWNAGLSCPGFKCLECPMM